jgi:purine-binding chemotaxis protein CheW
VAETQQFCTFLLKNQVFGIPVQQVQEVLKGQDMTRVPLAPEVIRGLINLRGQIVMAVDLRRRFGMEDRPEMAAPLNVVVRTEEGVVSLLVDDIGDVLEVEASRFEDAPQTLQGEQRELVKGVYQLPDHLMLVLDTERACQTAQSPRHDLLSPGFVAGE